jgi:ATP-dependent Lon protease
MKFFEKTLRKGETLDLPVVPLRDLVVFPGMVVPVFGGRRPTIEAIEEAMTGNRKVFLLCQKTVTQDPREEDLYTTGCVGHILQMMKLPDNSVRILVEGQERASLITYSKREPFFRVEAKTIRDETELSTLIVSLMRTVQESFKVYTTYNKKVPPEVLSSVERADKPDKLVDIVCAHVSFKLEKKVDILGIVNTETRLRELVSTLQSENEILELQQKITGRVKKRIEKGQREYFLQEQMKEINRELGREPEDPSGVKELEDKIQGKGLPEEVLSKVQKELKRLEKLQTFSPEAGILRTYIEWITDLPWNEKTEDSRDIERAAVVLDEDHYDLKKPKERILDFIAVHQLKEKVKGPILCFVGPPGTGKTSLGKSVARCLGRTFVRISLGGVRDEAEIRGHRKTYVGALPGKIIQSMRKAGNRNPVFLLDEVDKMSSDFRGDPAAALLEVLDPEQNATFVDHYLEVPYDLSNVMFITTANSLHNIPYALRDRMEVIEIPGYTEYEKLKIAEGFIIPKQLVENGLDWAKINFRRDGIKEIIQNYTMESGVRNLEREIAHVIRKLAREAVRKGYASPLPVPAPAADENRTAASPAGANQNGNGAPAEPAAQEEPEAPAPALKPLKPFSITVNAKSIHQYLGNPKYKRDILYKESRAGLAYGLAWTELGGTILPVEAAVFEGKGDLLLTGSLGDIMKESALTSYSYLKSYAHRFKLASDFYRGRDIHIHVPAGAIPKDGPSAGITITAALLSSLSGVALNPGFAMTGEITLTGRILPIGGIKEKVLAAHRNHMLHVLLPEENRMDIDEIPTEVVSAIDFVFVDTILEALMALFPSELFQVRAF